MSDYYISTVHFRPFIMADVNIVKKQNTYTIVWPPSFLNVASCIKQMLTSTTYLIVNVKALFQEQTTFQKSFLVERCIEFQDVIINSEEDYMLFRKEVGDLMFVGCVLELIVTVYSKCLPLA